MNTFYRNTTMRNVSAHKCAAWYTERRYERAIWLCMLLFAFAAATACLIYTIVKPWQQDFKYFALLLILAVSVSLIPYYEYRHELKKLNLDIKDQSGKDEAEFVISFDEIGIVSCVEQREHRYCYEQIDSLRDAKQYFVLCMEEARLLLDKQGFSQGEAAEFCGFICRKAPQAKYIK